MFNIAQQPQGLQIFFHYLKACILNLSYVIYMYDQFFETGCPSAECVVKVVSAFSFKLHCTVNFSQLSFISLFYRTSVGCLAPLASFAVTGSQYSI